MNLLNEPLLILKKGTENNQEKEKIIRKIQEYAKLIDSVKSTLVPRSLEKKLIEDKDIKMSNHDAAITKMPDFKNKFE